jgi:hypothetical protein
MPSRSTRSSAHALSISPEYTPDATMPGAKRAPSSFVQLTRTSGASVSMPSSSSRRMTSSPASTPSTPSNLPPVGCVSRCEPKATGARDGSRPGRVAYIEPMSSIATSRPIRFTDSTNQSRTARSSSPSASRQMPPLGVPPNSAVSMIVAQRRSGSVLRFVRLTLILPFGHHDRRSRRPCPLCKELASAIPGLRQRGPVGDRARQAAGPDLDREEAS